ncbi:FMN-binding protein [Brachyspira sp. G79]|uniref:FMN-binding protein n=1 Tax=Brachyspira sp. G79 TaxID=1358104 RepID=UPI000BBBE9E0|nr:FMN-binding protein [Brachyspira sp. G79]PCG20715.1 electron transporter [Brachyspira sp. G79]
MKKEVGYTAVISVTITALLAGFLLSFVYSSFEKDILANNEKTVLNGVKAVIEGADELEGPLTENSAYPYYIGKKADGTVVGYAMLSSAGGYNGENKVLVGFDANIDTITAIVVTEQAETPGLGAKITEASFRDQFKGQSSIIPLSIVKGIKPEDAIESQIAAISGATISSTSVVNAVNSAKDEAVNLFKN